MEVSFDEKEAEEFAQENGGSDDDAEMNYIRLLFKREINNLSLDEQQAALINDRRIRLARTLALSSMLLKGFELRFLVRRVYISVVCLNRILASGRIDGTTMWGMWVLGVACLSVSAQMDDNRRYVPGLSQYEDRDCGITGVHIRKVQRLILYEFKWNIPPFVTPFPFADFFLSRINRQVSEATRMKTVLFILMVILDVRLMTTQRSSVIAVAAILLAVNNNLTRQELETQINVLPLNEFLDIGDVWYCYNRLRRLNNRNR